MTLNLINPQGKKFASVMFRAAEEEAAGRKCVEGVVFVKRRLEINKTK